MSITLQCSAFPLSGSEVEALWSAVRAERECNDVSVTVRCVSITESADLNADFRKKKGPTNVLTFSYSNDNAPTDIQPEHDIALCMDVVLQEAQELGIAIKNYTARVVVHALLHATGMDHEHSEAAAKKQEETERAVLTACGYGADTL